MPLPPEELVEQLVAGHSVRVERIVSSGHSNPSGDWAAQDRDEWVVLLEGDAELEYEDGTRVRLASGDHVLIPAGKRHRVEWTRKDPPCVWIAVHADQLMRGGADE
ncbi:MAG: cupin domain-containing protein [Actinomycetota bacterium]